MLENIISDEVYKDNILEKKYVKEKIKKISFSKMKKKSKYIIKRKNLIIAEKKVFSPSIGFNSKFNKKIFKEKKNKNNILFLSKLTNSKFFNGRIFKKKGNFLRKDFIFDYYQMLFTLLREYNFVLLIKKNLSIKKIINLIKISNFLGITTIVELCSIKELKEIIESKVKNIFLGINSRNLSNFLNERKPYFFLIKKKKMIIYESGIINKNEMIKINNIGFKITLIGENFAKKNFYYEKNREVHKKKNKFNK
ncbi:Indole-3-glycerol phosphate synthase [Candidatus Vidania fulgoroideae]|nr:Indole-3-glycerol phosphate synthase [Candidatus Vidania fulgoroideae]